MLDTRSASRDIGTSTTVTAAVDAVAAKDFVEGELSGYAMLESLGSAEKRKAQFMDLLAPKNGVGK
jgi:hypothetical protein